LIRWSEPTGSNRGPVESHWVAFRRTGSAWGGMEGIHCANVRGLPETKPHGRVQSWRRPPVFSLRQAPAACFPAAGADRGAKSASTKEDRWQEMIPRRLPELGQRVGRLRGSIGLPVRPHRPLGTVVEIRRSCCLLRGGGFLRAMTSFIYIAIGMPTLPLRKVVIEMASYSFGVAMKVTAVSGNGDSCPLFRIGPLSNQSVRPAQPLHSQRLSPGPFLPS
jgi:hypothetical protein